MGLLPPSKTGQRASHREQQGKDVPRKAEQLLGFMLIVSILAPFKTANENDTTDFKNGTTYLKINV